MTWCQKRGIVVKGNGVEETPYRFGAPAVSSIGDGVGNIQQRRCSRPKPNQNNQLPRLL
jgi:hypothetical protein